MTINEQTSARTFSGIASSPKSSLLYGAQDGYNPRLGGLTKSGETIEEWASNTSHTNSQLICIPMATPGFFKEFEKDQADYLRKIWVDIMSILPTSITGLTSTLTVESEDVEYGASGSLIMKESTRVTKAVSEITNEYVERQGMPINEFLEFLIRFGVGNEFSQIPEIATVAGVRDKFRKKKTRLKNYYSGSAIYFELDAMHVNVEKAWYAVGIIPTTGGEVVARRDLKTAAEVTRYSIPLQAMVDSNAAITGFAQLLVDKMSIFNTNASNSTIVPIGKDEVDLHTGQVGDTITDHSGYHRTGFESDAQVDADKISEIYQG